MATVIDRRGSQPALSSHPLGHGRTKSLGQGMGSVPMSPGATGLLIGGSGVGWEDIQAR